MKLCVPSNVTVERKRLLHAYGAEMIFTDPMDGSDGAIREARKQVAANPDLYFYPDQYNNDANWRAHYDTTGAGDSRADRTDASRTSSPASAPAVRSWEPAEGSAKRIRRSS